MPVAIVTGANKGIGLSIVRKLLVGYPQSDLCRRYARQPLLVYLTARSRERGQKAVEDVRESELTTSGEVSGLTRVEFKELDVAAEESVQAFKADMEATHEGIDILVNNAGVALDGFDEAKTRQTLDINYHGTIRMTKAFLPTLLTPHARIVNMSSMLGKLNKYSPSLTAAFRAAADGKAAASSQDPTAPATALMDAYADAVAAGTHAAQGWPDSAYAVSKAGVTAATMALGAHEKATRPSDARYINACCPGYVATDMTGGRGRKKVEQGAELPVRLALGDIGGVTGEFWERDELGVW